MKWERHRFSNNSAELSQRQYKTVLPNIDIPYHEQEEPYVLERMENHTIQLPDMIKNDITSLKMDHSDSSELTLQRVSLKESGLYVCVVFNNMGYTKMNVTLEVLASKPLSLLLNYFFGVCKTFVNLIWWMISFLDHWCVSWALTKIPYMSFYKHNVHKHIEAHISKKLCIFLCLIIVYSLWNVIYCPNRYS